MDITFEQVREEQYQNNGILANGVKSAKCLAAASLRDVMNQLNEEQRKAVHTVFGRLFPDEYIGTVEVYDNGALNLFLHRKDNVADTITGYFLVRA